MFTVNGMVKSSLVGLIAAILICSTAIVKIMKDNRESVKRVR